MRQLLPVLFVVKLQKCADLKRGRIHHCAQTRLLSGCSGWSIGAKKHGLGDPTLWSSELHQGVEGPQGLPQGCTLEQILFYEGGNEIYF